MTFFKTRKEDEQHSNKPSQVVQFSDSLQLALWSRPNDVQSPFHWNIWRMGEKNANRSFRSLKVASLLELPVFLTNFAKVVGKSKGIPEELREEIALMAAALEQLSTRPPTTEDGNGPRGILSL